MRSLIPTKRLTSGFVPAYVAEYVKIEKGVMHFKLVNKQAPGKVVEFKVGLDSLVSGASLTMRAAMDAAIFKWEKTFMKPQGPGTIQSRRWSETGR